MALLSCKETAGWSSCSLALISPTVSSDGKPRRACTFRTIGRPFASLISIESECYFIGFLGTGTSSATICPRWPCSTGTQSFLFDHSNCFPEPFGKQASAGTHNVAEPPCRRPLTAVGTTFEPAVTIYPVLLSGSVSSAVSPRVRDAVQIRLCLVNVQAGCLAMLALFTTRCNEDRLSNVVVVFKLVGDESSDIGSGCYKRVRLQVYCCHISCCRAIRKCWWAHDCPSQGTRLHDFFHAAMLSQNVAKHQRAQNVLEEHPVQRHHSCGDRDVARHVSLLGSSDRKRGCRRSDFILT